MMVTDVRAAYPKWRRLPPVDAWQAHFWQIAVRVDTDVGVVGHGYGGGGEPWGLHLIVATDCLDLAETMPHRWQEPREGLWLGEPEVTDGTIEPSDDPGFGVRLNEDLL